MLDELIKILENEKQKATKEHDDAAAKGYGRIKTHYHGVTCGIQLALNKIQELQKTSKTEDQEPKTWEIWCEGYLCSWDSAQARCFGTVKAKTFKEACGIRFRNDGYFNADTMTYWTCKLFDNESDARKAFG